MKSKLTLSIDKKTKEQAKRYAKRTGTSISQIVEEFLNSLSQSNDQDWKPEEGSAVEKMTGVIKADEPLDYKKMIVEERAKKYEDHSN